MAVAAAIPHKLRQTGYTATPHTYFKRLFRRCDKVELAIVGNILDETVGELTRPEWARITEHQFAIWANATVDGVHKAIKRLESQRLIESRAVGRNKEYRALVENFAGGEDRPARTLNRKPPQSADLPEAAAEVTFEPREHIEALRIVHRKSTYVLEPGEPHVIPVPPETRRVELQNESPEPLELIAESADETLQFRVKVQFACTPTAVAKPIPEYGYSEFHAFLTERYSVRLMCDPPEAPVRRAYQILEDAGVSLSAFTRRLNVRDEAVTSWGIIPLLAEDCAKVFRRLPARTATEPQPDAEEQLRTALLARAHALTGRPEYRDIAADLNAWADNAAELQDDTEKLEINLQRLESQMLAIAEQLLSPADRAELARIAEASCRPLIDKMSPQQRTQLLDRSRERLLAERPALPRLSLFYS